MSAQLHRLFDRLIFVNALNIMGVHYSCKFWTIQFDQCFPFGVCTNFAWNSESNHQCLLIDGVAHFYDALTCTCVEEMFGGIIGFDLLADEPYQHQFVDWVILWFVWNVLVSQFANFYPDLEIIRNWHKTSLLWV